MTSVEMNISPEVIYGWMIVQLEFQYTLVRIKGISKQFSILFRND